MKRVILLFVVSAILVLALAVPAMAKTFPPGGGGEPILSGSINKNGIHGALHCGPLLDAIAGEETNTHGAFTTGGGGNCVQAPRR
jgi:hypothetical protein